MFGVQIFGVSTSLNNDTSSVTSFLRIIERTSDACAVLKASILGFGALPHPNRRAEMRSSPWSVEGFGTACQRLEMLKR